MAKNKFYAVRKGIEPGIYTSWDEAKTQIDGFSGAEYKSFKSRDLAEEFMGINVPVKTCEGEENVNIDALDNIDESEIYNIYVDGSFNEELNTVGYGIVVIKNDEVLFKDASRVVVSDVSQRNIIGEVYATIRAIQLAIANDYKYIRINYDYVGIEKWLTGEWKAKTELSKRYVEYMNIYLKKMNIGFNHTYGHTNIFGNEVADGLAKLGCTL